MELLFTIEDQGFCLLVVAYAAEGTASLERCVLLLIFFSWFAMDCLNFCSCSFAGFFFRLNNLSQAVFL
jgi:hypothetical protein